MKKSGLLLLLLSVFTLVFQSCDDYKTYAEMLEEEKEAINRFIDNNDIDVITVTQYANQDSTTLGNEYVLFSDNGIYMHILQEDESGRKAENGDQIMVRFIEVNIMTGDTLQNSFNFPAYVDEFRYTKTQYGAGGTFTSVGLMSTTQYDYGGTYNVFEGWIAPLNVLKIGTKDNNKKTRIRLIVPGEKASTTASGSSYIYPYYYELTLQYSH